ncbi:hypothetical protein E2C01_074756 [Portunus trituberculatus]|uniref:Uncharacterized protein n=1 Tax=Portunus trituberculatus TaxID=210409 RepID=A0A5B7ID88_PORTR|nr:hypothetical protein [Portunus trituberculatus]
MAPPAIQSLSNVARVDGDGVCLKLCVSLAFPGHSINQSLDRLGRAASFPLEDTQPPIHGDRQGGKALECVAVSSIHPVSQPPWSAAQLTSLSRGVAERKLAEVRLCSALRSQARVFSQQAERPSPSCALVTR